MIANTRALEEAAKNLGIPYQFIDKDKNVICLDNSFYFANASTPLNREDIATICKDKEFTYAILKETVQMPSTRGYFDPRRDDFKQYRHLNSYHEIAEDIDGNFSYPLIVKRNRGEGGKNVIKCSNKKDVTEALEKIYDQNSKQYDYVALAQEYIEPKDEFRATVLNRKIVLLYTWVNSKPTIIDEDTEVYKTIEKFIAPIFSKLDVTWAGIDIVRNNKDELFLLELNSKPAFNYFCEENGLEPLIRVYKKVLSHLYNK